MIGENHGVLSERTDQTLRSPLKTFLAIFDILGGARKKIWVRRLTTFFHSGSAEPDRDVSLSRLFFSRIRQSNVEIIRLSSVVGLSSAPFLSISINRTDSYRSLELTSYVFRMIIDWCMVIGGTIHIFTFPFT